MCADRRHGAGLGARVAFFGSSTLLAREIRSLMEGRAFGTTEVRLYDRQAEGAIGEFAGEALLVTAPDEDAIVNLDLAFMCGGMAETEPYLNWAARKGFVAIDLSGAAAGRPGVPLVHAEINPGDLAPPGGETPSIVCVPHPVSHNLATVAAALRRAGGIESLEATALRPVSEMGEAGIDELYRQTVALLNFTGVPQEAFGRQMAFNVLPSPAIVRSQAEGLDERIRLETARLLGMEPGAVGVGCAMVPVFHGHAVRLCVSFLDPVDDGALRAALEQARGIRLIEDPAAASPVELAGEDDIALVDLHPDAHRPGRFRLWAFCDNLKSGAALNAVRVAERLADRILQERR